MGLFDMDGAAFMFSTGSESFVFWNRRGTQAPRAGGRISINSIFITGDMPKSYGAKGYCRFGNLYSGRPTEVVCNVNIGPGHWSAVFITDGTPPREDRLKSRRKASTNE
jgi:hypothetical protein